MQSLYEAAGGERGMLRLDEAWHEMYHAQVLHNYFAWTTTATLTAYPDSPDDVPDGLVLPRWSWEGLQA